LAAATAFEARRAGRPAGAVVVDHAIQDGSAEVAAGAAGQCRDLGLDPVRLVRQPVAPGSNLEARARAARYGALDAVAAELGAGAILLGHTLDDQAETVLLALARGSGPRAVAGMAWTRGLYRRPLLGLRRATTLAACAAAGLKPWTDPMNSPGGPHRSVRAELRAWVLPALAEVMGPGVAPALARTADLVRADGEYLDELAEPAYRHCASGGRPDRLDIAKLTAQPEPVRRRVLRLALLDWGVTPGSLSAAHIAAVDALAVRWHGQGPVELPGGFAVGRECGKLGPCRGWPGGAREE
jgi:tRNA(Ile)-lysidine synthase